MGNWKRFLVCMDGSEISFKALRYVARFAARLEDPTICLLHVYPEPPPYYFQQGHALDEYCREKEGAAALFFARSAAMLEEFSIKGENVPTLCRMSCGEPVSRTILTIQAEGDYGTVVVGKRGVSKAEEFLFGSISNTLARHSAGFTVWVVG